MSKRQHNIKFDYKHRVIDVKKIDPSPFQVRKYFDEDELKELAASIQREGLIEPIEAVVEIEDAELTEDKEYASMGKNPANRVKALLVRLDSLRCSKEREQNVTEKTRHTSNKFIGRVEKTFKNLPKPLE